MKKLFIITLLTFAFSGAYAQEFDLSVYHSTTISSRISEDESVKLRAGVDTFYAWASYGKHDQRGKTQSMGHFKNLAGGLGFERGVWKTLEIYGELGVGYFQENHSKRVVDEVVYYTFADIFGAPPFQEGWWDTLEQKYEVERTAPVINLGARFQLYKSFRFEVEYNYAKTSAYFATWNPTWNGGPNAENFDACGCYWEGTEDIDFSGWSFGINYEF